MVVKKNMAMNEAFSTDIVVIAYRALLRNLSAFLQRKKRKKGTISVGL
jgi:hypothetical protein